MPKIRLALREKVALDFDRTYLVFAFFNFHGEATLWPLVCLGVTKCRMENLEFPFTERQVVNPEFAVRSRDC